VRCSSAPGAGRRVNGAGARRRLDARRIAALACALAGMLLTVLPTLAPDAASRYRTSARRRVRHRARGDLRCLSRGARVGSRVPGRATIVTQRRRAVRHGRRRWGPLAATATGWLAWARSRWSAPSGVSPSSPASPGSDRRGSTL
jgi:hypothetical protein